MEWTIAGVTVGGEPGAPLGPPLLRTTIRLPIGLSVATTAYNRLFCLSSTASGLQFQHVDQTFTSLHAAVMAAGASSGRKGQQWTCLHCTQ
jgi:hypothetical protein